METVVLQSGKISDKCLFFVDFMMPFCTFVNKM